MLYNLCHELITAEWSPFLDMLSVICARSKPLTVYSLSQGYFGAGCSSEVERLLMVRWVAGSILHGVDPLSYFSFQPVLHDWCNKSRGMCYPVWDGAHKRTLAVN